MKNQEQVLLALLLLALTSMSAVAGGMNTTEPFFEEHPADDNDDDADDDATGVADDDATGVADDPYDISENVDEFSNHGNGVDATHVEPKKEFVNSLPASEKINIEGFTGGMYAGF